MLKFSELARTLGVSSPKLNELIDRGLPVATGDKNRRRFDLDEVNAWLIDQGLAEPPRRICRTYAELSTELGVPVRTIQHWATDPGFPGRPGSPGRAEAYLPVDEIQQWRAAKNGTANGFDAYADDDELRELQRRIKRLELEQRERDALEQLGRLANVEDVARFNRQCVANAKAVLEPLADEVVAELPPEIPPETRARIHRRVATLIDNSWQQLADIVSGDTDRIDELEDDS